jgi:hypothetical protein
LAHLCLRPTLLQIRHFLWDLSKQKVYLNKIAQLVLQNPHSIACISPNICVFIYLGQA